MEDIGICYDHSVFIRPFGIFYGHLQFILWPYFVAIWHMFPVLVCCTKKNLATLVFRLIELSSRFPPVDVLVSICDDETLHREDVSFILISVTYIKESKYFSIAILGRGDIIKHALNVNTF
jgi:hypothetical protein